jgi:predicted AAA+ superfamily ATPase
LPYIFLDEIQEVQGWEKWVRMMHELGKAKLIISGSNAHLLSRELGTLLTGRHLDLIINTLSFKRIFKIQPC